MNIFRIFRPADDAETAVLNDMERRLEEAARFPKMPLLEQRSDECEANMLHLNTEKASLEERIAELQEELRHVNVALEAERERTRIVNEGLGAERLVVPKMPLRVDSIPDDAGPFTGSVMAVVGAEK